MVKNMVKKYNTRPRLRIRRSKTAAKIQSRSKMRGLNNTKKKLTNRLAVVKKKRNSLNSIKRGFI
jgi:hypothetical protein